MTGSANCVNANPANWMPADQFDADQRTPTLGVANLPVAMPRTSCCATSRRRPATEVSRRTPSAATCSNGPSTGSSTPFGMRRSYRSADSLITVGEMAVLFCSDTFWDQRGDDIVAIDPTIEVVRLVGDEHLTQSDLERITIAFFSGDTWPERSGMFLGACTRAPNLEWLQTFSAGTDHPIFGAIRDAGAVVTNSSGSSAPSIAQTVLLYLLALSRDLPRLGRAQAARRWEPGPAHDLHGLRLGVVGLGEIGTEVARLAEAFGMKVVGVAPHRAR